MLQVSAGGFHAVALLPNGTVVAWGDNVSNQTNVPPSATNVTAISAGAKHTLALRSNGTVVAWGLNQYNQTNVPANLNGVIAVAAGADHSLALRTNGTLATWGGAVFTLTNMPSGLNGVSAIAAGATASLALRTNGTVVAWGSLASQTNVPPSATNIMAISVGASHCLALRSNGTVVAWGDNVFTQTNVPANLNGVVAVSAGWYHSLALRTNGSIVAWGLGNSGQTTTPTSLTNASQISAANSYNLALNPLPFITTRPPSVTTLAPGQATTLSITVLSGSAYTVQWFLNDIAISSQTNNDIFITGFNLSKAGRYSVVVSNQVASAGAAANVRLSNAPVVFVSGLDIGGGSLTRTNFASIIISNSSPLYPNVFYTLDGGTPNFTGFPNSGTFTISNSVNIRAIAYNNLFSDSAESTPIALQVIPTYPLLVAGPGSGVIVSPPPASGTNLYLSNTVVTLTATPSNGWTFLNWSGDSTSTNPVIEITMSQPRTLNAVFGTTLNLLVFGNGFLVLDPPGGPYPYGTTVTMTALPFAGNYFFGWAGWLSPAGFANPVTFTATNGSGITALFGALQPNQVSLVVQPVGGGSASVSPFKNVYTNGEPVSIAALGTSNRVFVAWSGDASGSNNPLALTLASSRQIYANFAPGTPTNQPVFTLLPAGKSLSVGGSTTLASAATGDGPLYFQWRRNGLPLESETNVTLALTNMTTTGAGLYDVVVSGSSGAATSPAAPVALFGLQLAPSPGPLLPLLTVDCASGANFRLEHSDDLSLTNWTLLSPVHMTSPQYFFVDSPATNTPQRFYRLVPQ